MREGQDCTDKLRGKRQERGQPHRNTGADGMRHAATATAECQERLAAGWKMGMGGEECRQGSGWLWSHRGGS